MVERHGGVGDIAGNVQNAITDPQGPLHAGDGDQIVQGGSGNTYIDSRQFHAAPERVQQNREVMRTTEHRLEALRRMFVPPPGFDAARQMLARPDRVVLLGGAPGSGRRTAAQMLLCGDDEVIVGNKLLAVDTDESASEVDIVADGDRLLLDLSELDEESFLHQQNRLHALQPMVVEKHARLVVVLPADHEGSLRSDFLHLLVVIDAPESSRVFAAHLREQHIDLLGEFDRWTDEVAGRSMAELERLARYVGELSTQLAAGTVEEWVKAAIEAPAKHRESIDQTSKRIPDARGHSLFIAVALLDGAPLTAVFGARQSLLELVGHVETGTLLQPPGATAELKAFDVEVSASGRLQFAQLGRGNAVLDYYWDEFPRAHRAIGDWVRALISSGSLPGIDQRMVALRFAAQCGRSREADLAIATAEEWAQHRYESVRNIAYDVLSALLEDHRTSGRVRSRLYSWSTTRRLPPQLASLSIALCADVLASSYLDQAIVRLCWLAKHSDPSVAADARGALRRLARGQRARRVVMLLFEEQRFAPEVFADAVSPQWFTEVGGRIPESGMLRLFEQGWAQVIEHSSAVPGSQVVWPWLDAHCALASAGTQRPADLLLKTLIAACRDSRNRRGAVLAAVSGWLEAAADPAELDRRRPTGQLVRAAVRESRDQQRRTRREEFR